MSPKNCDIYAIFNAAVEQESNDDRARYLDEACGGDTEIRAEVESLLRAHLDAGNFLGGEMPEVADTVDIAPSDEKPGMMIGRYQLIREISHGGMGVVYMAVQQEPVKRRVALKIIKPGMDTREVVARFNAERQALALMDHQSIAHVLDGGSTEFGRPYFVMELVDGTPITEYCDECRYTTRQRLELFIQVCHAVQHAHLKGVIHRDIKPSNILVTHYDGAPVPKVIDFGIAKALHQQSGDQSLHTHVSQMVGTPLYMSPEQAQRTGQDIDTRTDVYSLGVLLYELLTGTTPFDKQRLQDSDLDEVKRIIREEEPPKPSARLSTLGAALDTVIEKRHTDLRTLARELSGELDWIVMKALEKDRNRRYETVNDLAKDVQRYLDDEPVEACPPSAAYRLRKYVHRNRARFVAVTTIAAVLVIAAAVSTCLAAWAIHAERISKTERSEALTAKGLAEEAEKLARRQEQLAREQRQLAMQQRDASERNRYLANIWVAQEDWRDGRTSRLYSVLGQCTPRANGPDFRRWEWYYLLSQCHQDVVTFDGIRGITCSLAWSPNGKYLASANNQVLVWDFAKRCRIHELGPGTVYSIAWSPDGQYLCYGGSDGSVVVCRIDNWTQWCRFRGHNATIRGLAWSPDSRRLASVSFDHTVRIWDTASKSPVHCLEDHSASVRTVAWGADDRRLVTGNEKGTIKLWDLDTGDCMATEDLHRESIWQLAWRPDGQKIASASSDKTIKIWDVSARRLDQTLTGHTSSVTSVSWRSDGTRLASGSLDETVRIWDVAAGRQVRRLRGHRDAVCSVAWQPGSGLVASGSAMGLVKIWDPAQEQETTILSGGGEAVQSIAFAAEPRRLASVSRGGTVKIWNTQSGKEETTVCRQIGTASQLEWSPDDKELLIVCEDRAEIWDLDKRQCRLVLGGHEGPITSVSWGPGGRHVALACQPKTAHDVKNAITIWDAATGAQSQQIPLKRSDSRTPGVVTWNPDGRRLAFVFHLGVRIWDVSENRLLLAPSSRVDSLADLLDTAVTAAAWSPDGRTLAASLGHAVRRLDGETLTLDESLRGHNGPVYSLAWHPDGDRLASASSDGTLRVWDTHMGREIFAVRCSRGLPCDIAWSSDGRQLATANEDGTIEIWDSTSGHDFVPSPVDRLRAAWQSAEAGQFDEALQAMELLAEQHPDISEFRDSLNSCWQDVAWTLATNLDSKRKPPVQTRSLANRLVTALPAESSAWLGLAATQYRSGDVPAAEKTLQKVAELGEVGGRWRLPYHALATMVHWRLGNNKEAYLSYLQFLVTMENEPLDAQSRRLRTVLAVLLQRSTFDLPSDEAIALATSLHAESPETDAFRTALLNLYSKRAGDHWDAGRVAEEIQDLTAAIQLARDDIQRERSSRFWLYDRRARAYEAMGDAARAISDITEMIQLRHREDYAYLRRGELCQREEQFDQAIRDFDKVIDSKPKQWLAYFRRAAAYAEKKDFERANADLKTVLEVGAGDASALNAAAWYLVTCPAIACRDTPRAIEAAQQAVRLSPNDASVWNTLGVCQYRAADYRNALQSLARAMDCASGGSACDWLFVAMCHWQLGDEDRAQVWLERATAWMEENSVDEELQQFHKEAADLIVMPDKRSEEEGGKTRRNEG